MKGVVDRGTRDAVEAMDAVEGVNPTVGEMAKKATRAVVPTTD